MINRRNFLKRLSCLAAAGFGLTACIPLAPRQPSPASTPAGAAPNPLLFAGSYTESGAPGISRFLLDPTAGTLTFLDSFPAGDNPSFLAVHPSGRYLYAVNEISLFLSKPGGAVSAFAIDPASGKLSALNQQPSLGTTPCHLATDRTGQALLVANYSSGTVALLPVADDGSLKAATIQVQHAGQGPNPRRQEGPHAHFIAPDPTNTFALSCDLGIDKVLVYRLDAAGGVLRAHSGGVLPPGSGPRHLDFSPAGGAVYVINELNSTLTVFAFDPAAGTLVSLQTLSTLPEGYSGTNAPAEVLVHPSGRFVYGSNRGHDSIAIYTVDAASGLLALTGHEPTRGKVPRSFVIDPSGTWLLAANQDSDSITAFRIDPRTGSLTFVQQVESPRPVCLKFWQTSLPAG